MGGMDAVVLREQGRSCVCWKMMMGSRDIMAVCVMRCAEQQRIEGGGGGVYDAEDIDDRLRG
jgi:hypothetical protein